MACVFENYKAQVSQVSEEHCCTAEGCGEHYHAVYQNLENCKERTCVEQDVDALTKEKLEFATDRLTNDGQCALNIEETCHHCACAEDCQPLDYLAQIIQHNR